MPQTTKKPTRATSTKTKPKKKAVPEFAKPFYKKLWFAIFALILVFAGIGGGYMIRKGDAASYTFIRRANQMKDGSSTVKIDGVAYRTINFGGQVRGTSGTRVQTFLTAAEARSASKICAHYKVLGDRGGLILDIFQRKSFDGDLITGTRTTIYALQSGNLCLNSIKPTDSIVEVFVSGNTTASLRSDIGVDTIYGKP